MALYSITYDLVGRRDYEKIFRGIKEVSNNSYTKPTESQWIIKSSKSAEGIVKYLEDFVDDNDILFVIPVDGQKWSALNLSDDVCDWLNKNYW